MFYWKEFKDRITWSAALQAILFQFLPLQNEEIKSDALSFPHCSVILWLQLQCNDRLAFEL